MESRIKTLLEQLDLSQNEIKLYYAALHSGEATIAHLAQQARIHRVAAYALVDALIKKGLLTASRGGTKRIAAKHPRQIETLLAEKRRAVRKLELRFQEVLPQLTLLYQESGALPSVSYYEGIQGLRQMSLDVIEVMKELPMDQRTICSYTDPNRVHELFEEYVYADDGIIALRKLHGIYNRAIVADGPITRDIMKRDAEELREMIVLSPDQFPFENDVTIYANKMGIKALHSELIGVIIESKDISKDQRTIFELAWAGAKTM